MWQIQNDLMRIPLFMLMRIRMRDEGEGVRDDGGKVSDEKGKMSDEKGKMTDEGRLIRYG